MWHHNRHWATGIGQQVSGNRPAPVINNSAQKRLGLAHLKPVLTLKVQANRQWPSITTRGDNGANEVGKRRSRCIVRAKMTGLFLAERQSPIRWSCNTPRFRLAKIKTKTE